MSSNFRKFYNLSVSLLGLSVLWTGASLATAQDNKLITKQPNYNEPLDRDSFHPATSADGMIVAFASLATDFAPGADQTFSHIYFYDRSNAERKWIEVTENGNPLYGSFHSPVVSGDGSKIAFRYETNPYGEAEPYRIYIYDRVSDTVSYVHGHQHDGYTPVENYHLMSLSHDGEFLAFSSPASDLVANDTNNYSDIFVYNTTTGEYTIESVSQSGSPADGPSFAPTITAYGQLVAFQTDATNLLDEPWSNGLAIKNRITGAVDTPPIDIYDPNTNENRIFASPYLSSSGDWMVFASIKPTDFYGGLRYSGQEIFVYNRNSNWIESYYVTDPETLNMSGYGGNPVFLTSRPSITDDGQHILFGDLGFGEFGTLETRIYLKAYNQAEPRLISSNSMGPYSTGEQYRINAQISRTGTDFVFATPISSGGPSLPASQVFLGQVSPSSASPKADAGADISVRDVYEIPLDGTLSSDDITSNENLSYAWEVINLFDDQYGGASSYLTNSDTATPTLVLDAPQESLVRLIVRDQGGLFSGSDYVLVTPNNEPPTAQAGPDQTVMIGDLVSLNGLASSDPEQDSLTYSWALSGPVGSTATLNDSTLAIASFTPDIEGTFTATLNVSDAAGPGTPDSISITALSPFTVATGQVNAARDIVAGLSRGDFDNRKRQGEMLDEIDGVLAALTAGDSALAISRIDKLLLRVDGCTLRGSADAKGKEKDWVTSCSAQIQIYDLLIDAKSVL